MEVAPGIHRIETPLENRLNCLYLFVGSQRTLLIDSGLGSTPGKSLLPYLDALGLHSRQIHYVITTHADIDHMGGNAAVRTLSPDALFMCHELDRRMIEDLALLIDERYGEFRTAHGIFESTETLAWMHAHAQGTSIDLALSGNERIHLGSGWLVEVLHTPGHSRGHLSVADPRSGSIVVADAVLGQTLLTQDGRSAFPPIYRYVDSYLETIQRLQNIPITPTTALLTSHFPVLRGQDITEFLHESRNFVNRVEQALIDELMGSGQAYTMRELINALSRQLGDWADGTALVNPFQGHLERLISNRQVLIGQRDDLVTFKYCSIPSGSKKRRKTDATTHAT
ncbi:MAG: MBL fold metallo-hydrolase [Ktedonobacteraceae bacterium]|nr:MBL fold metallo-hydrolase [Ktedonobacteraceae bacterium]